MRKPTSQARSDSGLSPEMLKDLSKRIQAGLAARGRLDKGGVPDNEREVLTRTVADGIAARGRIVEANIPLVEWVARRFMGQRSDIDDLVQEGCFGLIRAAELFNPEKGFRFSTYALPWIRQSMAGSGGGRFAEMHVPMKVRQEINHVLRTTDELTAELHRTPTREEIASRCHIATGRVDELLDLIPHVESIDAPMSDESDSGTAGEKIPDPNAEDVSDAIEAEDVRVLIVSLISDLEEPERTVLSRRFGLTDGRVHTLDEVATDYNLTRAALRQMELRAMLHLRNSTDMNRIRAYLHG